MNKRVIVAGHVCLDITPAFPDTGNKSISDILMPGKLIETKGVSVSTGGAVANTGLAMKFFGADVRLMGKVGNDDFGEMICNITRGLTSIRLRETMDTARNGIMILRRLMRCLCVPLNIG